MFKRTSAIYILLISIFILASCQGKSTNNPPSASDVEEIPANNTNDENNEEEKNEAYEEIVTKSNDFGVKVIDTLSEDNTDSNQFISPVSMYTALSMLVSGADNDTQSEIATLLGADDMSDETLNEANQSLLNTLNDQEEDDVQLDIANSVWVDKNFDLNTDYENIIDKYFTGKIASIDRNDGEAADGINDWISEKTNDKIDKAVEAPLSEDFAAMLVNAVYFNGNWSFPFDADETEDDTFHLKDGEEKEVPFMNLEEKLDYVKHEDYEAVKLPYGEDSEISMVLFSPSDDDDLDSIHQAFQKDGVEDIIAEMQQTKGNISLPKFKIDYEEEMDEVLTQLGMQQAFDKGKADFPNMIEGDDSLYVSEVKHSTYLDVDEEGTEAAGSTNVGMETTSMPVDEPFDVTFNHPFTMLIFDEKTGAVLFMGDMYDVST